MNQKIILIFLVIVLFGTLSYLYVVRQTKDAREISQPSSTSQRSASITFQETGGGCADIFVFKTNEAGTAGISVSASKEKLNLSISEKTFEIGTTDGLNVEILVGDEIARLYCNDMLFSDQPESKKYSGKSGNAVISISAIDESQPEWSGNYTTTVILKDVRFSGEKGESSELFIDELIFKDIRVGWMPG